jgi:hypothetical protein
MKLPAFPDFLLVGAARAGTTALDRYLRQHPQVYLPRVKEPCFFAFAGSRPQYRRGKFSFAVTGKVAYASLFRDRKPGQIAGDLSTPYLFLYRETIGNIVRYHPDPSALRIVMILRQPVDRAYSQYRWRRRDGREELSFREAVDAEPRRKAEGYSFDYLYLERSHYAPALQAYRECFPHLLVLFYEDLRQQPEQTLQRLCNFLGIDANFRFRSAGQVNGTWSPRYPWLSQLITLEHPLKYRLLNRLPGAWRDALRAGFARLNASEIPEPALDADLRSRLTGRFLEDIRAVEAMTGRNLDAWK